VSKSNRSGAGITVSFVVSTLASIGLAVVYALGGQVQLEGVLLGAALGGLGVGLIIWGKELMPQGPFTQQRATSLGDEAELEAAEDSLEEAQEHMERRGFLAKMLAVAVGALGLAALFPIRSLGARPGRELYETEWREGVRLVTLDRAPVRTEDLDIGGVITVFPEEFTEAADSQTLLIRIDPEDYDPLPGREDWAPEGFIAFSKVCTHAGCPVGLYQPTSHELFCPCHQSVFAVLEAAVPTAGPATRPLPQLPLAIENGYIVAQSDYLEPVGPGFWRRGRD
jgi:ubiquinol-cytochrome c reductase iron-sulfur subunit